MMETLLFNTLLFLGVVWMILGIAYLWSLLQGLNIKPRKDTEAVSYTHLTLPTILRV